jgi:hypothetical protein
MPLFRCPDCGKQIIDASPVCPHCGRPVAKFRVAEERDRVDRVAIEKTRRGCVGCLIVNAAFVVLLFIIVAISEIDTSNSAAGPRREPSVDDIATLKSDYEATREFLDELREMFQWCNTHGGLSAFESRRTNCDYEWINWARNYKTRLDKHRDYLESKYPVNFNSEFQMTGRALIGSVVGRYWLFNKYIGVLRGDTPASEAKKYRIEAVMPQYDKVRDYLRAKGQQVD